MSVDMSGKKKQKTMAQAEYLERGANQCPFCRSENISGETFESSGDEGTQMVRCDECGKKWFDVYKLVKYEVIES